MRRRCLAALERQHRCWPRGTTTTAAAATASEPLSWLGAERGITAVNQSSTFRARFLAQDARGFAAKSLRDAGDAGKALSSRSSSREGAEGAEPQVKSSASPSTSSSSSSNTAVAELAAIFTCNVCDLRSAKGFSRVAFERGVIIVTCEGCESMHVLADRLGWFGGPGDAADFLKERSGGRGGGAGAGEEGEEEEVRTRAVVLKPPGGPDSESTRAGVLELMPEDLEGWSRGRKKKGGEGEK